MDPNKGSPENIRLPPSIGSVSADSLEQVLNANESVPRGPDTSMQSTEEAAQLELPASDGSSTKSSLKATAATTVAIRPQIPPPTPEAPPPPSPEVLNGLSFLPTHLSSPGSQSGPGFVSPQPRPAGGGPVLLPLPPPPGLPSGSRRGPSRRPRYQPSLLPPPPLPPQPPVLTPTEQYWATIQLLAAHLPHLRVVTVENCRNLETRPIVCYDYKAHTTRSHKINISNVAALNDIPNDTTLRLVLLEDLDPHKIALVGSAFQIGPGFFSSHLQDAGYGLIDEIEIPLFQDKWSKFRSVKGQFSLNWLRPVRPSVSITNRVRNGLVNSHSSAPRLPCIFPECESKRHTVKTNRNIFRQAVGLSAQTSGNADDDFPIGWEERMTVWKGQKGDCSIIILCFDPLPSIRYLNSVHITESELLPRTNQTTTDSALAEGVQRPMARGDSSAPQAESTQPPIDTLPPPPPLGPLPVPGLSGIKTKKRTVLHEVHTYFTPFRALTTRGVTDLEHEDILSEDQARTLADKLRPPSSSLEAMEGWLDEENVEQLPQELLLHIIHADFDGIVNVIRVSLEDIGRQSIAMSPLQLQEHALQWRSLLGRYQYEIRRLIDQLPRFVEFLYTSGREARVPQSSIRLRDQTLQLAKDASDQVERAYVSLRAELSIAEARRSIQEAESVAKLTELAFLFIPLTFAASLFSMQIKELDSGVPVSYFVGTALALIGVSYLMRLAVRSSVLRGYKGRCFSLIREHADISESDSITTRQFLEWFMVYGLGLGGSLLGQILELIRISFTFLVVSIATVLLAIPLIFFWKRNLNKGYSAVITMVVLPMDLWLLWTLGAALSSSNRGWKKKLNAFVISRKAPRRRRRRRGNGPSDESDDLDELDETQSSQTSTRSTQDEP